MANVVEITITTRIPLPLDTFEQVRFVDRIQANLDKIEEFANKELNTKVLVGREIRKVRERNIGSDEDRQVNKGEPGRQLRVFNADGSRRTTAKSFDGYVDAMIALVATAGSLADLDKIMKQNGPRLEMDGTPDFVKTKIGKAETAIRRQLTIDEGAEDNGDE